MRRFRRRARHQWLPSTLIYQADVNVRGAGATNITFVPVLQYDTPGTAVDTPINDVTHVSVGGGPLPLVEWLRQGYYIKRIVGKIHASITQTSNPPEGLAYVESGLAFAGLFIDRINSTGALESNTYATWDPIAETSQVNQGGVMRRWLWRRSWILGNRGQIAAGTTALRFGWPATNAEYGSIQDGPHVDWKGTARSSLEERLWLVLATKDVSYNVSTEDGTIPVSFVIDLRVLGGLARQSTR